MPSFEEIAITTTVTGIAAAAGTAFIYAFITFKTNTLGAFYTSLPLILRRAQCDGYQCQYQLSYIDIIQTHHAITFVCYPAPWQHLQIHVHTISVYTHHSVIRSQTQQASACLHAFVYTRSLAWNILMQLGPELQAYELGFRLSIFEIFNKYQLS